jgi:3-phenylpropionate/cinnamic acid dioxygenase small subunit
MATARPRPETLLAHYAELIDAGDFEGVGALFADASITDATGQAIATGAHQVEKLYRTTTRRFADGTPKTKHLTTNAIVEESSDGSEATVRSYFVVFQQLDGGPLQPIAAGRYVDHLALVDGAWRFRERRMVPEMFGDVSNHLLFDPSDLVEPGDRP